MRLGRDAFYAVWDMAAPEALAHLHAMLTLTDQTDDAAEGIAAFWRSARRNGGGVEDRARPTKRVKRCPRRL